MGHADLLRVARVGLVAVADQHCLAGLLEPQRLLYVLVPARLEEREAHLVVLAIDRPEVRRVHLARPGAPGLDRRLVHRLDAAGADRRELRLVDGLEQLRALLHQLRQPWPAELEARRDQPLVLPVQRKLPRELVHQQPDDEAHIGAAALDDAQWCRRAVQRLRVVALDHRAHVLQDHVAAGSLRQAVAGLLADHLVLVGTELLRLGVGHLDRDHRHLAVVEERRVRTVVGEVAARPAPRVRGHLMLAGIAARRHGQVLPEHLAQVHLLRIGHRHKALALAAEQLALEPLELPFQRLDLLLVLIDHAVLGLQQPRDVLRIECGHLGGIEHSLGLRDRHGRSSYRGRVVVSTVFDLIARAAISL